MHAVGRSSDADVTTASGAEAALAKAAENLGGIDDLIVTAGVLYKGDLASQEASVI